jgi:hypothetical protein
MLNQTNAFKRSEIEEKAAVAAVAFTEGEMVEILVESVSQERKPSISNHIGTCWIMFFQHPMKCLAR